MMRVIIDNLKIVLFSDSQFEWLPKLRPNIQVWVTMQQRKVVSYSLPSRKRQIVAPPGGAWITTTNMFAMYLTRRSHYFIDAIKWIASYQSNRVGFQHGWYQSRKAHGPRYSAKLGDCPE